MTIEQPRRWRVWRQQGRCVLQQLFIAGCLVIEQARSLSQQSLHEGEFAPLTPPTGWYGGGGGGLCGVGGGLGGGGLGGGGRVNLIADRTQVGPVDDSD